MQPTNKATDRDALEGLEAYLDSLDGDPNAALERISTKSDPENVRRRLAMLIDGDRMQDAVAEVRSRERMEAWIDLATYALAATGGQEEAKDCVAWARELPKLPLWQRSVIAYCDGTMRWAFHERSDNHTVMPGQLTEKEDELVQGVIAALSSACGQALTIERPESELEVELLTRLLDASYAVGDRSTCRRAMRSLNKRVPVPLRVAHAVLQGIAEPQPDLAERLWTEHGESFLPKYLSCAILGQYAGDTEIALERALQLQALAKSAGEETKLSQLLYSLTNLDDSIAFERVASAVADLLGAGSNVLTLMNAEKHLRQKDWERALALLDHIGNIDDPQWSRIRGLAFQQGGRVEEALLQFQALALKSPSPWVFRKICSIAAQQGKEQDEINSLESLLALDPDDDNARRRIASLYGRCREYKRALLHLEKLHEDAPDDFDVLTNLAVAYSFDGRADRALSTLDRVVKDGVVPLQIALCRSQILLSLGRTGDAFVSLHAVRNNYWDDAQFLGAYMTAGHADAKEAEAHEALSRLMELKKSGVVDDRLLREVSLEEIREMMSLADERSQAISRHVVEGKFPWVMSAEMAREAVCWAWTLRTQPIKWLTDKALTREAYCIYATNGFRVLTDADGNSSLDEVKSAEKGNAIVVDISSIVTLYALGLLPDVGAYYGRVLVPADYLSKAILDSQKLFPHQLSQKMAAEAILDAVNTRRLKVQTEECKTFDVIDEYDELEGFETRYRIADLIQVLCDEELVSEGQKERAQSVSHKVSATEGGAVRLKRAAAICVSGSTLTTLVGIEWLKLVSENFDVHISQHDFEEIKSRLRAFEALDAARRMHTEIWDQIQTNPSFEFVAVRTAPSVKDADTMDSDLATAAFRVAKEYGFPLLADDRVCQMLMLNERRSDVSAAFGTDALLYRLADEGVLTQDRVADALLRIIAWRYRFVVFPPELLVWLAKRYSGHLPGIALRQVAAYVHDCMRDHGLFAGPEPVDPPVPIAVRLYQTWVQTIAEFVTSVWLDEAFDETSAQQLTRWAMSEFLPSPPRKLNDRIQASIATLTARSMLSRALISSTRSQNPGRMNLCLREMAAACGLDESEYLKIVIGVIDEI